MRAGEQLAGQVQLAAALIQQRGGVDWAHGPAPRMTIETRVEGCRYRLRFAPTVDAAVCRAKRLLRPAPNGTNYNRLPPKPTLTRARYSQAVYDQFIEDGEPENAEAYRGLYDV